MPEYLEHAMKLVSTDVAWSFSWANKTAGVQVSQKQQQNEHTTLNSLTTTAHKQTGTGR